MRTGHGGAAWLLIPSLGIPLSQRTRRSSSSAARSTSSRTSSLRLGEAAQHMGGDDLRVGRVRPSDADADAPEVRAAQPALERLQAVVAGQAAAEPRLHAAEGQVDLVVHDDDVVEVHPERAAGGSGRAAGVVHVGLRQQHADARAARAGAAVGVEAGVALLGLRQAPALGRQRGDLEADVVASARVAVAGIPRPDDEPVDLPAARRRRDGTGSGPLALAFGLVAALGGVAARRPRPRPPRARSARRPRRSARSLPRPRRAPPPRWGRRRSR